MTTPIKAIEIDTVIAQTALAIIADSIRSDEDGGKQSFRIKNLTLGEISALLSRWKASTRGTHLENMRLLVAGDADSGFPAEFRADSGRSITWYRNHNDNGLVYIETKVETDEQGLKNIFTLRDNNFLDGSFNHEGFSVPEQMFIHAWQTAGGSTKDVHVATRDRVLDVLNYLHPKPSPVSARKFARFCLATSKARRSKAGNLDREELDAIVGDALEELDLFPDKSWCQIPTRTKRRLAQNALHSELVSNASSDLDQDKLLEDCQRTIFKGDDGSILAEAEQRKWRNLCSDYCNGPTRALRSSIPYAIFEQLFRKEVAGLPLGERVGNEIEEKTSERFPEYESLQVKAGLDRRDAGEAQRFLESEASDPDESRLSDLLSTQTRRMVEKVAWPSAERIANPLSTIAELASIFRERQPDAHNAMIEMRPGRGFEEYSPSVGLLAFVFGKTLLSVECSPSAGLGFRVDPRLVAIRPVPSLRTEQEDETDEGEDGLGELQWQPVPLEFHLVAQDSQKELDAELNFEWFPDSVENLALLWLFLAAEDAPSPGNILAVPPESSLEKWLATVSARATRLDSCISKAWPKAVHDSALIGRLYKHMNDLRASVKDAGLDVAALQNCFDEWYDIISEAKDTFVPEGVADERISAFLGSNCIETGGGSGCLMLPSHPFRLRWLSKYLLESEIIALKGLADELRLNRQNNRLYLDSFASRSPHQQPAISCTRDRRVLLAVGEYGWAEHFSTVDAGQSVSGVTSDAAADEIYRQVEAYLNVHPHRADGLSILLAIRRESSLPANLVRTIRRREWRHIDVTVHVLAPQAIWPSVVSDFETLSTESRLSHGGSIFPPVQLRLHELPESESLASLSTIIQCDLAIAPQLLGDRVIPQELTEPNDAAESHFDVLLDDPTYVHGGLQGGTISISTRPANPDSALDMWSSLTVRHYRTHPVSPQQPQNTDYLELTVDFAQAARLFEALHTCAHWVITLERHISREQIESLEPSPDILTVREGVGAGGLYTLIVSSNVGRSFVIHRLERKLRRIVGADSNKVTRQIAERIYDSTREIAPGLVLQATGISRVTEEILGLMIARQIADSAFPASPRDGVVIWISLDDHADWFRGVTALRADLIRLTLEVIDGSVHVDVLVVEGKLRTAHDRHGIDQVKATLNLVEDFLPPTEALDARQWRTRVLSAVASVSPEARRLCGSYAQASGSDRYRLPLELRTNFRDGSFVTRQVHGLFALTRYDAEGELTLKQEEDESVFVARAFKNDIMSLVSKSDGVSGPTEVTPTDTEPRPIEPGSGNDVDIQDASNTGIQEAKSLTKEDPADAVKEQPVTLEVSSLSGAPQRGKLSATELTRRYQTILDQFDQFNIKVQRASDSDRFVEGPASVLYRLKPSTGVDPKRLFEKADALKLALALAEEQRIRFSIDRGYIVLDVPKADADRYFVDAEDMWKRWIRPTGSLCVPLGEDSFGAIADLEFSSSNSPHLLIGGTTGSGKSEALNTILTGLTRYYEPAELRLLLVDPKGTELLAYSDTPHLDGEVGFDEADALVILERAVEEMGQRYEKFKQRRVRSLNEFNESVSASDRQPWWVLVLDEYADLTSDPDAKKQIEGQLKRLAQKARASGIHVVIATQKPSAEVISTNLRSNLPAQLALRVKSATESRVVMDEAGAETLNGKGDAFLKTSGKLSRIQCAIVRTAT